VGFSDEGNSLGQLEGANIRVDERDDGATVGESEGLSLGEIETKIVGESVGLSVGSPDRIVAFNVDGVHVELVEILNVGVGDKIVLGCNEYSVGEIVITTKL